MRTYAQVDPLQSFNDGFESRELRFFYFGFGFGSLDGETHVSFLPSCHFLYGMEWSGRLLVHLVPEPKVLSRRK